MSSMRIWIRASDIGDRDCPSASTLREGAQPMATAVSQPVPWYNPPRIAKAVFQAKRYPVLPLAILMLFLVIPAVFAPLVAPHDPLKGSLSKRLKPPAWAQGGSIEYPLGTDKMGRDILSRIIHGSRVSLM